MKKLFIIFISSLCLVSCSHHTTIIDPTETRFTKTQYGNYYVLKDIETGSEYLVVFSSYGIAVTKM